jgi:hypothetical protein
VCRIREFILFLLGKWSWRLLVDKEWLWFEVLWLNMGWHMVEFGEWVDRLPCGGRSCVMV